MEVISTFDPEWDEKDEMELVILQWDDEEDDLIPMTSCCAYSYFSWYVIT